MLFEKEFEPVMDREIRNDKNQDQIRDEDCQLQLEPFSHQVFQDNTRCY